MSNSCELSKYDQSTALWQGNKFLLLQSMMNVFRATRD